MCGENPSSGTDRKREHKFGAEGSGTTKPKYQAGVLNHSTNVGALQCAKIVVFDPIKKKSKTVNETTLVGHHKHQTH